MKNFFLLGILMAMTMTSWGQSAHRLLRQGDKAYLRQDYEQAEERYRKSLLKKESLNGSFNLGNTIYSQERFDEAIQHYESTIGKSAGTSEKARALFNLGNARLQAGQIEPAIESYKEALNLTPDDRDIRQNLFLAKLMQREQQRRQQEQQQQQQSNQENQEEQNQNNEQQQEQQQQQQAQNQSETQIDNQGKEQQDSPQRQKLSREDALKLLEVIENEEKSVQEKLRKVSGKKKKPAKDW